MAETDPEQVEIALVWVGLEDLPVFVANQMVIQHTAKNEFVLSFGHLSLPVFLGTDEERVRQAKATTFVPIKPVARVGFNRDRIEELITILRQNVEKHDAKFANEESPDD